MCISNDLDGIECPICRSSIFAFVLGPIGEVSKNNSMSLVVVAELKKHGVVQSIWNIYSIKGLSSCPLPNF